MAVSQVQHLHMPCDNISVTSSRQRGMDSFRHNQSSLTAVQRLPKAWHSIVKKRLKDLQTIDDIATTVANLKVPLASIGDC